MSFIVPYWEIGTNPKENIEDIKNIVREMDTSFYAIFESVNNDIKDENNVHNMCILVCKVV
jgi:hypothetical protein